MASPGPQQSGHPHPGEFLRAVVAAVVPEPEQELYLPFAAELYATFRRAPSPDFTRRTRLVVRKWFGRGLSGHRMWLIGERLLGRLYPPRSAGVRVN